MIRKNRHVNAIVAAMLLPVCGFAAFAGGEQPDSKQAQRGPGTTKLVLLGTGTPNADPDRWARDLLEDRDLVFLQRTAPIWFLLGLAIPFLIGGWTGFLWGGLVRVFLTNHVTWSVNSVCHVFGARPFKTKDHSGNQWLVGLLAFGEGAHNTHHASPRSARHGLYWWHFDMSWVIIRLMARLGLAHDVYTLDKEDLKRALASQAGAVKVALLYPSRRLLPSLEGKTTRFSTVEAKGQTIV